VRLLGVGAAAREPWRRVLPADPDAVVTQTPAWLECICAVTQYENATRAYEAPDGRTLVLPLARARRLPAGAGFESSMPWGWGTGGVVCPDGTLSGDDVAAIAADLGRRGALRIAVRPGPSAERAWTAGVPQDVVRTRHMVQVVDLSGGFDHVWQHRFSSSARRGCVKAERSNVEVEWDDTGRLVGVFDALYRTSVARWAENDVGGVRLAQWRAQLREPRRKFETVAGRMGAACRVWVAWRAGEAAAAIIVLTHADHCTYWRGAMDPEVEAGTRANNLLHRLAIEDACRAGRRFYHMGESDPSSSLARFKRGFGAEDRHYTGFRFERLPLTAAEQFVQRQATRGLARVRRMTVKRSPDIVAGRGRP
jgi:Acetyltransferase (GNAT) domain